MSIIGEAAAGKYDAAADLLIFGAWGVVSLALAIWMGLFRRRGIQGPARVGPAEPLGPLVIILLSGFLMWILLPGLILVATGNAPPAPPDSPAPPASANAPATRPAAEVSPAAQVGAQSAGSLAALALLLLANFTVRGPDAGRLGIEPRRAGWGVLGGLIASVGVVWLVFMVANATELLWRRFNYRHPAEHELLKMLSQSKGPAMSLLLIFSATLVAPLFEEVLFRGYLQTILTHALARLRLRATGGTTAAGFPVALPAEPISIGPVDPPGAPVAGGAAPLPYWAGSAADEPVPPWVRWLGVILASLVFSGVHAPWTIPPIFALSVLLGFAYERTGNLWVPITMHAAFNITSTVIYVLVNMG